MDKTVFIPESRSLDAEGLDEPASSWATVTRHENHRRVVFSGGVDPEGDVAEQVRTILDRRRRGLEDLGGSMDDVVVTRFYVEEDVLSTETQAAIHEVRAEFFERPHYPASTMVGVASLLHPGTLVEIELEAEIPDDAWTTEVVTGEE